MEDTITIIQDCEPVVISQINIGPQGPQGPQGPPGKDGVGTISSDEDNALATGSDGGLFCKAVKSGLVDW